MDTVFRPAVLAGPRLAASQPGWVIFFGNAAALLILLVLVSSFQFDNRSMRVGEVAGQTVIAQQKVVYVNHHATAEKRRLAGAAAPEQYLFDAREAQIRYRQASAFFSTIAPEFISGATMDAKRSAIRPLLPFGVSADVLQEFLTLGPDDFRVVETYALRLLRQAEASRFEADQVQTMSLTLLSTIPPHVTFQQRTSINECLLTFLVPTLVVDPARTHASRKQAAKKVAPVHSTIYPGEVVVRRGDIVTPTVMEELVALGLQKRHTDWHDVAGALLFATVIVAMFFWYLHAFHPSILQNPRILLLIDVAILSTVVGTRLLASGHVLLPYFLPVATTSIFAAVLIAPEACIALALTMAVLAGWVVAGSFELTMYYFLSASAGVLAIKNLLQIKQFILAGIYTAGFGLATLFAFELVNRTYDLAALQEYVAAAAFNGFVSSTLALGGFALLSGYFGVTTSLQLLELSQPSQPLLRRLLTRAPGTYNHSLVVSNMVEHASEAVGANALVARVGALYHDVGKTANPHAFVENQLGIGNLHDDLHPDESARIIRAHVTQGIRMARQAKLPRVVLDAIAEHHGTTTLAYFLHKAKQEASGQPIDASLYSYPGPRPQTKETALLMLADGCESAVRAAQDHSQQRIREVVAQIFSERIQQSQLDESPLTLKDLERAQGAFCAVLNGLYHPRIEYPDASESKSVEVKPRSHRAASHLHG